MGAYAAASVIYKRGKATILESVVMAIILNEKAACKLKSMIGGQ